MVRKNTLRNVVKAARDLGIRVSYRVRSDGGIRIVRINGEKANPILVDYLREMTGMALSTRQYRQREYARGNILPKSVRSAYSGLLKTIESNPHWKGTLKRATVANQVRNVGRVATIQSIREYEARVKGEALYSDSEFIAEMLDREGRLLEIAFNGENAISDLMENSAAALKRRASQGLSSRDVNKIRNVIYHIIQIARNISSALKEGGDVQGFAEELREAVQELYKLLSSA